MSLGVRDPEQARVQQYARGPDARLYKLRMKIGTRATSTRIVDLASWSCRM